jgi:hypothetical protein
MIFAASRTWLGFRAEMKYKMRSGEGCKVLGTTPEYTRALACERHVAGRVCKFGIMKNRRTNGAVLPG